MNRARMLTTLPVLLITLVLSACGDSSDKDSIKTIVFADTSYDSIQFHNHVAQTIIKEGYGYDTDVTTGSITATIQGLRNGDINAFMEIWTDNVKEMYEEAIESGDIVKASTNFNDNDQGLYVPTYVIAGDEERGIEPMAPDLKNYSEVFEDPDVPGRGRIINGPSG